MSQTTNPEAISGRIATKEDVESGRAVFYHPAHENIPYSFEKPLPLMAKITSSNLGKDFPGPGTIVTIVQAEQDKANITLGFVYSGGTGVCSLKDVSIQEHPSSWNHWISGALTTLVLILLAAIVWVRIRRLRHAPHEQSPPST